MRSFRVPPFAASLVLSLSIGAMASVGSAQTPTALTTVNAQVRDLTTDSAGRLLYCTGSGEVGRIDASGTVTVLADTSDGLPSGLVAVVETPGGDVAVAHSGGDVWLMAGGTGTPTMVYDDRFYIVEATDMIVDTSGNYIFCSRTPSSGTRGVNWVSADGQSWAYYLVAENPYALATDPLTGDLFISTTAPTNGAPSTEGLRLVDVHDDTHPTTPIDTTTNFGFQTAQWDGDVALDATGNAYVVADGAIFFHDRSQGTTTSWASGFGQLRGAAIAPSTSNVSSATGFSLFVLENAFPTTVQEFGNVAPPAPRISPALGTVPTAGRMVHLFTGTGLRVYELSTDRDGNLLAGGDNFGANPQVRRYETQNFTYSVVANGANGINDRVEGIAAATDGTIYAMTTRGFIHEIKENPLSVATLYTDPMGFVSNGKDMMMDRDGTLFLADRQTFDVGELLSFKDGVITSLIGDSEFKGLSADPFTSQLFITNWTGTGFCGRIDRYDFNANTLTTVPGFESMNYANGNWGDGDTVVDVEGNIYTVSEDDWRLNKYDPSKQRFSTIGSSYLFHPSGLAIAPSSAASASTTGWSLFVSEYDILWEIDSVPPPAPTLLDRNAPPVGELLGWLPRTVGTPRTLLADPAGGGVLISTDSGTIERIDSAGQRSTIFSPAFTWDITGMAPFANGDLAVATGNGLIARLSAAAGYTATVLWLNLGGELADVRGITVDGLDRVVVVARTAGSESSKVWRLDGGSLEFLTHSARGLRPAIDPLTGDVFVTERGSALDGVGEVLRIDAWNSPVTHGHYRGNDFTTFRHDATDGGIAFDDMGNFYVLEGALGRVARIDRTTGAKTFVGGNYDQPTGIVLAPGTPGIAGAQGTSLFVLDRWTVYEVGVDGQPAGTPPASSPNLAPAADLQFSGNVQLSTNVGLTIDSPANAGSIYIIAATLAGKVPGFPLSAFGQPDTRILPSNPDMLWNLIGNPVFMPASIGVLDGTGKSPSNAAIFIGPSPTVFNVNQFLDVVWVAIDLGAQNRIGSIGGTAQLFLGPQ